MIDKSVKYYEGMNMQNGQCVNVFHQKPTNAQENDDHYSMQNTQQNSLARVTKDQKKFQEKNGRIYSNSSNLIAYLQVTNNLLKKYECSYENISI